ncbi:MAG TPA: Ldh family oxidoreductase, partial [Phnomibacter sp.]|nr:Ldh family oxidoreductase [Phnomibacter sp.]
MELVFKYSQLWDFTRAVFEKMGCPLPDAQLATEVLLQADLRGIDSHGIAGLSGDYRVYKAGRIDPA